MVSSSEKEARAAEGVWTTGRMNVWENHKFQCLIETAIRAVREGEPFEYEDEKIKMKATLLGDTCNLYYTWKFPLPHLWSKETKTTEECLKCLPDGVNGMAAREVWCTHLGYNAPKCPYGVPTPERRGHPPIG